MCSSDLGYGEPQAKVNEKSQCFKGGETLVSLYPETGVKDFERIDL